MKSLSKTEQIAVNEFVTRLRDKFPNEIEFIKLYGSKARGTADEDSDIDVLVVVKGHQGTIDESIIDIVCDVLNEFGVFIETVTLTSPAYNNAVDRQYPFAINVEKEAIPL